MSAACRRGAAALGLAVAAACAPAPLPAKQRTAVRVQAVRSVSGDAAGHYAATIHPATTVEMAFRVGGYIDNILRVRGVDGHPRLLQEGDQVRRGTVLGMVRRADYSHRLGEARAAQAEAAAAREQAQIDFARATKLAASDSIARADLDGARARLGAAVARASGAAARVAEAQTALDDTVLRAPLSGTVMRRNIELGALVPPGAPAFVIADVSAVKAVFGVPDAVLDSMRLGTVQKVTTEVGRGVALEGHISRIAPVADPKSRTFEVEVSLPNPQMRLRAGMVAVLQLAAPAAAAAPVAVLPLTAVVRAPPGSASEFAVFVLEDGATGPQVRLQQVALGDFLGNVIPIVSGVALGQRVVVSGAAWLADGEAVQLIPEDDG